MSKPAAKRSKTKSRAPTLSLAPPRRKIVKTKSESTNSGSKQSCVIAMLRSPAGATIGAMMKATGWQQHSVRGFLAGVVRKRLRLKLGSRKTDGDRVYRITSGRSDASTARQSNNRAA